MNIKDKIEQRKKEQRKMKISFTADEILFEKLTKLRNDLGMDTLSPLLNEALWEWYEKNNEKLLKEIEEKDLTPQEYIKRLEKGELSIQIK